MRSQIIKRGHYITILIILFLIKTNLVYSHESSYDQLFTDYMKYVLLLESNFKLYDKDNHIEIFSKGTKAARILISGSEGPINRKIYSPKKRVKKLWSGLLWVPQYAHGNDGVIFALQAVNEKYDDLVILGMQLTQPHTI